MRADEKLTAFLELEAAIRACCRRDFCETPRLMKTAIPQFLIAVLIVCSALVQNTQAVSPPPDGGYPGENTAEGSNALLSLTTGGFNTAVGWFSLKSLTTGSFCTAVGAGALLANTADQNTATGAGALLINTTGAENTANGAFALFSNTIGVDNVATGYQALFKNTDGLFNTATGVFALFTNTDGADNTACGYYALYNTTGSDNTAIGYFAGANQTTGSGNIYLGQGITGVAGESNHTYIRNIKDTTVSGAGADTVTVDLSTGLLGHLSSSRRYKEGIKPMDKASEVLFALKPVTYRYKKEVDQTQSPAYGLIAEEVAEVNPHLVARNSQGQPESVHYEMVNAMLLNEFLKEHKNVEEQQGTIGQLKSNAAKQEATIGELKSGMQALTATVREQAALIQKVSSQLEASKHAPQVVNNP